MKQTAVEWLSEDLCNEMNFDYWKSFEKAKGIEKEQMINIIKTYHNNLFYLPLRDGEAERILELILTEQITSKL